MAEEGAFISKMVEDRWDEFDKDGAGVLDKEKMRLFTTAVIESFGDGGQIDDDEFERVFKELEKDGNIARD